MVKLRCETKITGTNYRTVSQDVQLLIDESFAEKIIPANDSVRLLDEIVEEMDLTLLMRAYNARGRKPAASPSTMLKILLYANMEGIYSSRKIATACVRDLNFIWLRNGEKSPGYHEIARFRSKRLPECAEALFVQLVKKLHEIGEIKFDHLFVDGTKIEANANKYSFVWKKSTNKYESRVLARLEKLSAELCQKYGILQGDDLLSALEAKMPTPFVHGRGHRRSELQRDIEALRRLEAQKAKYAAYQDTFRGRNSFSKTDPDATFMHMKDDHMRNAQLKPGYNVQIAVDSEYIVAADIFQDRNDVWTLVPFLKEMKKKLGFRYPSVTADSGYESEEAYEYLSEARQKPYIKPQSYEKWKKRSFKQDISKRENMSYDKGTDTYTCHAEKKLKAVAVRKQKSKSGYQSEVTIYECEDCGGCPYKEKCTKAKGNKKLYLSKNFLEKRRESYENILSEKGIRYRMNRSIQVEGAFGVLKNDYGFQRFLLRGKTRVKLEILLLCLGYNLNKLHAKIQNERTGIHLFEVKSA